MFCDFREEHLGMDLKDASIPLMTEKFMSDEAQEYEPTWFQREERPKVFEELNGPYVLTKIWGPLRPRTRAPLCSGEYYKSKTRKSGRLRIHISFSFIFPRMEGRRRLTHARSSDGNLPTEDRLNLHAPCLNRPRKRTGT
jgi:hypothetical protein